MGNDARLNILARVKQAQLRAQLPDTSEGMAEFTLYPKSDLPVLKAKLKQEFDLLGVEVFFEESDEAVRGRVRSLIAGKSVLSWDPGQLPYGLGSALKGKIHSGKDSKVEQGQAEIGLTGCEAALAETGSLAMISSPEKPRTASLLPFVHVAVIRSSDILLGMGEFFEKFKGKPLPYMFFITGPSRTADIELSLTLGVHGPGKVIAVVGP